MKLPTISLVLLLLIVSFGGCAQPATELVYDTRKIFQCEEATNITPSQSSDILTNGGIEVISTFCGTKTGVIIISMCGAPSLSFIAHEIRAENILEAEKIGFLQINTLINNANGTGYELSICE